MHDLLGMIDRLKRPKLLIRAARLGAETYHRDACLPRLLGYGHVPTTGEALIELLQKESALNALRQAAEASYSLTQHLDVLIALVAEARILRASQLSRARHAEGL